MADNASDTEIKFFLSPHETWAAMYDDCVNAQESIEFEQYIINNDEVGEKFAKLFAEKSRQNIKVRLILDKVGSNNMVSSPYFKEIRENGGDVYFYNPITWFNILLPHTWYPRNHTKTMLIDSKTAYTGGVCLAAYMHDWRDTQARFTGGIVEDVKTDFTNLLRQFKGAKRRLPSYIARASTGAFRYVVSRPHLGGSPIYREMLQEIKQAQERVCIASPYFLPPRRLRRALRNAVQRGVKVEIMSSEKTDVPLADCVGKSYYPQVIHFGIRVMLYQKSVLHAKYSIIDGKWATIGSTNIDYLSLTRNREANIILRDGQTVAELQSHFDRDLLDCTEATMEYYRSLPFYIRAIGFVGRLFRKML